MTSTSSTASCAGFCSSGASSIWGRRLVTIGTLADALYSTTSFYYDGISGLRIVIVNVVAFLALDILTCDAFDRNLHIFTANGYTKRQILLNMIGSFMIAVPAVFLLVNITFHWLLPGPIVSRFDLSLIIYVILLLALAEIFFTMAHIKLHTSLPQVHRFHHCAVLSSFTSNLMFDPLDILIELGIPLLVMIFVGVFVLQDSFALLLALSISRAWYFAGHDNTLGLSHTVHHRIINTAYNIYANFRFAGVSHRDRVRGLIIKPAKKDAA